jgi:hypothetical protein
LLFAVTMLADYDRRLQYGPGMRAQRGVEAAFLLASLFSGDVRFAWVTLGMTLLQTLSPRLVPVAALVAAFVPTKPHALGDLYFDFAGTRGACAASVVAQALGLWLVHVGWPALGMFVLAVPTASFLLAPTVGFCCGCACYVLGRSLLARFGLIERTADGALDVDVEQEASDHQH